MPPSQAIRAPDEKGSRDPRKEISDYFHLLQAITLPMRGVAMGKTWGPYRSARKGDGGDDFASLRAYRLGDEMRRIDWNATARTGILHVREYYASVTNDVWMLFDASNSMQFKWVGPCSKLVYAIAMSAGLGMMLMKSGHRIGIGWLDDAARLRLLAPTGDAKIFLSWMYTEAPEQLLVCPHQRVELTQLIEETQRWLPARTHILLYSDFLMRVDWRMAFAALAQRHAITAIRVVDPAEYALPPVGRVFVQDVETGEMVHVDTSDLAMRKAFSMNAQESYMQIAKAVLSANCPLIECCTAVKLPKALLTIHRLLKQRRRAALHLRLCAHHQIDYRDT